MYRYIAPAAAFWMATAFLMPQQVRGQAFDQVYQKGVPVKGDVKSMSPTEVVIEVSTIERKIPVNEISQIQLADDPPELRSARSAIRANQFEDAMQDLQKIDLEKVGRAVVKQEIQFYLALAASKLALAGSGDKAAAGRLMKNFLDNGSGSWHYYEAVEVFGDLALASGSDNGYAIAESYYGKLAEAPWPEYKMRAAVLGARALLSQEKYSEALPKFEAVIGASVSGPDAEKQKQFATVGKAVCLAFSNPDQGIALMEDVVAKNDSGNIELFARAYNAMGLCHFQAKRPKAALMAFLHTDVLFFGDGEAHAQALYYLSKLWGDPAVNQPQRAVAARTLLKGSYGDSVWASKN